MGIFDKLIGNASKVIDSTEKIIEGKGTTRLKIDNISESWLTQSIRPIITLWILTLVTYIMFEPGVISNEMSAVVFSMLSDIIKFYFIARTSEKIIKMITESFIKK